MLATGTAMRGAVKAMMQKKRLWTHALGGLSKFEQHDGE
jgi:hypothetical protein